MNRIKVAIGVGAVAAAAMAVTPELTAHASYSQCLTGRICIWQNNNYSGDFLGNRGPGGALANVSDSSDNRTSSWTNRSTTNARWYQLADGGGFCLTMTNTSSDPDLSDFENDKLSSWATNRAC